jgi:hypothetical protein
MAQDVLPVVLTLALFAPSSLWQEVDAVQSLTVWRQAQQCVLPALSPPPDHSWTYAMDAAAGPGSTTVADPLSGGSTLPVNMTTYRARCESRASESGGWLQCKRFTGMDGDILNAIGGSSALSRSTVTAIHVGFVWATVRSGGDSTTYCIEEMLRIGINSNPGAPTYERAAVAANGWRPGVWEFQWLRLTNSELTGPQFLTRSDDIWITLQSGVVTMDGDPLVICQVAGVFLRVELDVTPATTGIPTTDVPTTGVPTTGVPTTGVPTTGVPTTGVPTATTEIPTAAVPVSGAPTTGLTTALVETQSTGASTAGPNASGVLSTPKLIKSEISTGGFLGSTTAVVLLVLIPLVGIFVCAVIAVVFVFRRRKLREIVRQETSGTTLGTEMKPVKDGGSEDEYHNSLDDLSPSGVGEYHNRRETYSLDESLPLGDEGEYHNRVSSESFDGGEYHNRNFYVGWWFVCHNRAGFI